MSSPSGLMAAWLGAGHGGQGGARNRTRPSGPACCAQKSVRERAEELGEARRGQVVVPCRRASHSRAPRTGERSGPPSRTRMKPARGSALREDGRECGCMSDVHEWVGCRCEGVLHVDGCTVGTTENLPDDGLQKTDTKDGEAMD